MSKTAPGVDTRIKRHPERGSTDIALAREILDEGLLCHVGFNIAGQAYVIPMAFGRQGDDIVLHGATASRIMQHLAGGAPCCLTVSLVDGLVLAKSQFAHSMNFRTLMVFGACRRISDAREKAAALERLVEHLVPGRTADARTGNSKELAATEVVALPLEKFSIKTRSGPPADKETDRSLRVWAGVIPLAMQAGAPLAGEDTPLDSPVPGYASDYRRP